MKTIITNIYSVLSPVRGAALSALSVNLITIANIGTKASLKDNGWRAMRVGSAMLGIDLEGQEGFLE